MRRARVLAAVAVAVFVCGGSASAARASTQELSIKVSDGTTLACGLILPRGNPPSGGWPGLLLFHGLGQTHLFMEALASAAAAPAGFASLACDARGIGASGGVSTLDGPAEVQDARDLFNWLAARPDVSDTEIGAFGLSLGGGAVWNAAVAGVPFKAIVPAITWTDLGQALNPNGVVKRGQVWQLVQGPSLRWAPSFAQAYDDLLHGDVTAGVKSLEAARSSRSKLHSIDVPTLLLQGRHDFLFDVDQALAAYRLLVGPKRLYLGDLGHPPAANPAAEQPTYVGEAIGWFQKYLLDGQGPAGGVVLAHDPWDGATTSYKSIPPMRNVSVNLPGKTKLVSHGGGKWHAVRSVRLTGGPLETFGDSSVKVRYSGASKWTHLSATISIRGQKTPVTVGAARVTRPAGVLRIPLMDEAVRLPRGKPLVVTLAAPSLGGVFSGDASPGTITIGRVTLKLSLLKRTVSR